MRPFFFLIVIVIGSNLLNNCTNGTKKKYHKLKLEDKKEDSLKTDDSIYSEIISRINKQKDTCFWDSYLIEQGLVNIKDSINGIKVDLKYSSEDNFMKKDMYGCLNNCYLQPDVAEKLKIAQSILQEKDSTLTLLVFDGVRPRKVQQYMWDILDMPIEEKVKFVSNPAKGSLHNYGAAVDISIYDKKKDCELDMGTPYDYIGALAWPIREKANKEEGLLSEEQINNRKLLRYVMSKGGFFNIQTEWWHFNSCYRDSAKVKYSIIE